MIASWAHLRVAVSTDCTVLLIQRCKSLCAREFGVDLLLWPCGNGLLELGTEVAASGHAKRGDVASALILLE